MYPSRQHINDNVIWKQIINGDETALVSLYDEYVDTLYSYGKKITPKTEIIEDAIQDLLAEIWFRRHKLCTPDSVKGYLLKAFRQKLLKQLFQYKRITFTGEYLPIETPTTNQYLHTQVLAEIEAEFKSDLQRAMTFLTQKEQEAISLKYTENLSHDEIADIMEIKKQTLYNLLHTAIQKLTQQIKTKHQEDDIFTPYGYTLVMLLGATSFSV